MNELENDELKNLKEKAAYHYQQFNECLTAICEIDENEAANLTQYLDELGGC